MDSTLLRILAVLLLVAANGFFVAAEFALVASRRTRIEAMIRAGHTRAKLALKAVQALDRYISGTQLGITLSSLGLGWIGEPAVARLLERLFEGAPKAIADVATHSAATAVAFMFITFLHIVLGELTPRAMALLYPEQVASWVSAPLMAFTVATNPFIWLLKGSSNLVLRLFGLRQPTHLEQLHSAEELRMLVDSAHRGGRLEKEPARLLAGVFEFSEKNAREVMTPRTDIVALRADESLASAADRVAAAGRSRYPVYRGSLDDIAGIVHAKDILAALRRPDGTTAMVESLLRAPHFVPGSREVEDVLADMKLKKVHMVIVLDEFGGTAGLVTMEDLLEEIVGPIEDEYDKPRAKVTEGTDGAKGTEGKATVVFGGGEEIQELNARLGLGLSSDDYTTVGGFVFGALGRLPRVGDRVSVKGGALEVTAMEGRRVAEVRFAKA